MAVITVALGAHEQAIRRLEQSVREGWSASLVLGTDPAWDPVRDDPRVVRVMDELGVPNGYDPAADRGS